MKKYKRRCFLLAIVLVLSFSASIGVRATEIELQTENIEKEVPAAFYIEMNWGGNGTTIKGFFPGYTEEMERIQTYYSFDGVQFLPINDAVYWTKPEGTLESTILNTTIAISVQSPLKEYLAGDIEEFFICLKYEVDGIEYTSEIVKYMLKEQEELPSDFTIVGRLHPSLCFQKFPVSKYRYNITISKDATLEELKTLLPNRLPVELQLYQKVDGIDKFVLSDTAYYNVTWKIPDENTFGQGESYSIIEAINTIELVGDYSIKVFDRLFNLRDTEKPKIEQQLTLQINRVDLNNTNFFETYQQGASNGNGQVGTRDDLYLDFPYKPSGARAIIPSYSLDGGQSWSVGVDILSNSKNPAIEDNPAREYYSHILLLTEYESPYKEYLNGENNGFLIRFSIQGGTLQGDTIIKKFPEDYEYIPPVKDPNPVGSGGNENNVGNNNQVTDGKRPETDGLSIEASKMIEMQTSNLEQDVNHSKTKSQERNTKKAVGAGDKAINSGDNLLEEVILLPEEVSLSDKVEVDKEQALLENQNLQSTLRDNDEKNLKGIKSIGVVAVSIGALAAMTAVVTQTAAGVNMMSVIGTTLKKWIKKPSK